MLLRDQQKKLHQLPHEHRFAKMGMLQDYIKSLASIAGEETTICIVVTVYDRCGEFPPMMYAFRDRMRAYGIILPWEKIERCHYGDSQIRPNPDVLYR